MPQQPIFTRTSFLPLAGLGMLLGVLPAQADETLDFNFSIRPLLSDRCFPCHGPDARARRGGFRLDVPESALGPLKKRPEARAIVPGKPEASELYRRIMTSDPGEIMPPVESKLALSSREKELLRRWIEAGAEYRGHWAFQPIEAPAVPRPSVASWARNPIDAFVLERLEREGLQPSPEGDPRALARRLSLDMTGLPPTPEEVERFLADTSEGQVERLVERLLSAPERGELRAAEWLDLARFADTYGYQSDVDRDMSPWRDWVIRAFNEGLPYDDFVTWQVAGDLLPGATRDQVLATAFQRLHRQTNEGGSIDEEFRVEYVADRVRTWGTAFLGISLECARCHDHKYDPIAQKEYYQLSAFFANIDESGLYSHFTQAVPAPGLFLYEGDQEARHTLARERVTALTARRDKAVLRARKRGEAWIASGAPIVVPEPQSVYRFDAVNGSSTPNDRDAAAPAALSESPELVEGRSGKALRFSGDNSATLRGAGAFDRTSPFTIQLDLRPSELHERAVILHRSRAWSDSGSRGYEVVLEGGRPAFALIHFWPGNAVKIRARDPLPVGAWSRLTVSHDGSGRAQGLAMYIDGKPSAVDVVRDNLYKDILHRSEWGDGDVGGIELALAARFRDMGFRGGTIDEVAIYNVCLTPLEVRLAAGLERDPPLREELLLYHAQRIDPEVRAAETELAAARRDENAAVTPVREIMVMREMSPPRITHVLRRGAYHSPGEEVEPGTPARLLPFPEGAPRNRLGLARWMVSRGNPLTARVAANRTWKAFFGRGLVATAEELGSQGQLPTHPQLLDWLAARLLSTGWDLKDLERLIATSSTYRQSSLGTPGSLARDPDNRLLGRGPHHRLAAEVIRDSALAVSGLLTRRIGGRSVKPYQPAGLWEEAGTGKSYTPDTGEKLYRRSLYTFWRRTAPPPSLLTFDATSREVCVARRETTTTPLQALVLLNDPQFLEAARVLAESSLLEAGGNSVAAIRRMYLRALGRSPDQGEVAILERLLDEQRAEFAKNPEAAEEYLRIGEKPVRSRAPREELAALAVLASGIFNLDELSNKR